MSAHTHRNLVKAKNQKNDDFYTQLVDIEQELKNYRKHFKGKVVYCNCDDPRISNFFHYFSYNFEKLGLKKLITTCYKNSQIDLFSKEDAEHAIKLDYNGDKNGNKVPDIEEIGVTSLKGDGDFRSQECVEILKEADIVVTNPPFSLFREYIQQLDKYNKKFIIIGNKNAITYKEVFKLIKEDEMWIGQTSMSKDMLFNIPKHYAKRLVDSKKAGSGYKLIDGEVLARASAVWFTNMDHQKRHEELILYKKYSELEYPKYDNYNAINVDKVAEIPMDYDGYMGVPITFLDKHNRDQFEIFGIMNTGEENKGIRYKDTPHGRPIINGKEKYLRILIRKQK